jgi:ribokinase
MGNGGKGSNQAVGIARLGVGSSFLVCIGDDLFGHEALEMWRREGVDAAHALVRPAAPTMVGFIILLESEAGDNRIITDPGANSLLSPADVEAFAPTMRESRAVLTQMEIGDAAVGAAMAAGRRAGVTTILNPAPARPLPDEVLGTVDILTPNQSEARILAGLAPDDPRPDRDVAGRLFARGIKTVVLTLGEDGALIVAQDGEEHCPGQRVAVEDTTGAGDGFNAALAAGLAEGRPLREAVERANHAGALVCTQRGVVNALPTREQLERFMRETGSRFA